MGSSTIYDIKLRYMLEDRASRGMQRIANNAERASKQTGFLRNHMGKLAALGMASFGLAKAGKALVGFNSDMEQAKTTMAGMIQLNVGGQWEDNLKKSNDLITDLQARAKRSVGTTTEFVKMAAMIARPITAAGLGMKDLADITAGAAVAARAFNIKTEMAALDIEQVLMGLITKKDRFAMALLSPIFKLRNLTMETFRDLDARSRADILKEAFNSSTLQDMAAAQADTFAGVFSTFQDAVQRFGGQVGMPLFKALTSEIKSWGTWMDKNQDKVTAFANKVGGALSTGFSAIKSVINTIYKHRDLIMVLAKMWLAKKVLTIGFGKMAGMAEWAHAISGNSVMMAKWSGRIGNMLPKLQLAAVGLSAFAIGAKLAADNVLRSQEKRITSRVDKSTFADKSATLKRLNSGGGMTENEKRWMAAAGQDLEKYKLVAAKSLLREAARMGMVTDSGGVSQAGIQKVSGASGSKKSMSLLDKYGADALADNKRVLSIYKEVNEIYRGDLAEAVAMSKYISAIRNAQFVTATNMENMGKELYSAAVSVKDSMLGFAKSIDVFGFFDKKGKKAQTKKKGPKTKIKVDIHKIEVQSDDPDRFAFQLMSTLSDAVKNRSGAFDALEEG